MPVENPLINLKDIRLPPPVSFWPPAPGWWISVLLILLISVFFGRWLWRYFESRKPKMEALRLLKDLQSQHKKTNEGLTTLRNLSQLLRRAALTFYAEENVASLHGTAWLEFLDKTGKTTEFTLGAGQVFGSELYQQKTDLEIAALFPLVNKWLIECSQQH